MKWKKDTIGLIAPIYATSVYPIIYFYFSLYIFYQNFHTLTLSFLAFCDLLCLVLSGTEGPPPNDCTTVSDLVYFLATRSLLHHKFFIMEDDTICMGIVGSLDKHTNSAGSVEIWYYD